MTRKDPYPSCGKSCVHCSYLCYICFSPILLRLQDSCYHVRVRFAEKLHKGLFSMKLPLEFMAIFCLAANDPVRERRTGIKRFLQLNIQRRRDFIKQTPGLGGWWRISLFDAHTISLDMNTIYSLRPTQYLFYAHTIPLFYAHTISLKAHTFSPFKAHTISLLTRKQYLLMYRHSLFDRHRRYLGRTHTILFLTSSFTDIRHRIKPRNDNYINKI